MVVLILVTLNFHTQLAWMKNSAALIQKSADCFDKASKCEVILTNYREKDCDGPLDTVPFPNAYDEDLAKKKCAKLGDYYVQVWISHEHKSIEIMSFDDDQCESQNGRIWGDPDKCLELKMLLTNPIPYAYLYLKASLKQSQ